MARLTGKVAIVTGGGSGFGAGIVAKFVSEGCKVVIFDVNKELAEQSARDLPDRMAISINGDVSQKKDWVAALDLAVKHFGTLDILVNNAGVLHKAQPSTDMEEEEYDRIMQINAKQLLWSTKVIIPYFKSNKKSAAVINVSSMSGVRPRPNLVWYAASKGAVNAATKGLALEFAPANIRFNGILPAVGQTNMTPLFLGHDESQAAWDTMLSSIPLGRLCQPRDVANAACFLASDESEFLTGVLLEVDGGRGL